MKVKILGTGLTKFGELWDKSLFDLSVEAGQEAIADSTLKAAEIDAVFVGNMLCGKLNDQDHLGAVVASLLGIKGGTFRVEGACASGGLAVHLAVQALMSGAYQNVLVVGVEKMTDMQASQVSSALMGAGSEEERKAGLTFPALYALMAKAHMHKFGTTRRHLAEVSVKNHLHASLNHKAQFPFEVSVDQVLNGSQVSSPFTLFDSSPITDGAAAVVLSTQDSPGVFITGSAVSSDTIGLAQRESLLEIQATKEASQKALQQAGMEIKDVNVAEVHDCFTIAEILAMEDLGFCAKGEGGPFLESQATRLGGKMPVNTSGGLKACGHPVGATGVKQIVEIAEQLMGKSGKRQVEGAKTGLTQNVGGTGATVVVQVLQR